MKTSARVLIVVDGQRPPTPLLDAVRVRAARGCELTLLVPAVAHGFHRVVDPEDACCAEAEATIASLLPLLEIAAGRPVETRVGAHEVLAAVEDALNDRPYDEVLLATSPHRVARWLHVDLPRKIAALGISVTALDAPQVRAA